MNKCKITRENIGGEFKFLLVTDSKSKVFKTLRGALKWAQKNNYHTIVEI